VITARNEKRRRKPRTTGCALQSAAPKREKELRRIQILLGLRAHETELRLLELTLSIQYLKNTGVSSAIALPRELEAALCRSQRAGLGGQAPRILTQGIEHVGNLSKRLQDSLLVALGACVQLVDRSTTIGA
jgi:hypothetical protein